MSQRIKARGNISQRGIVIVSFFVLLGVGLSITIPLILCSQGYFDESNEIRFIPSNFNEGDSIFNHGWEQITGGNTGTYEKGANGNRIHFVIPEYTVSRVGFDFGMIGDLRISWVGRYYSSSL